MSAWWNEWRQQPAGPGRAGFGRAPSAPPVIAPPAADAGPSTPADYFRNALNQQYGESGGAKQFDSFSKRFPDLFPAADNATAAGPPDWWKQWRANAGQHGLLGAGPAEQPATPATPAIPVQQQFKDRVTGYFNDKYGSKANQQLQRQFGKFQGLGLLDAPPAVTPPAPSAPRAPTGGSGYSGNQAERGWR